MTDFMPYPDIETYEKVERTRENPWGDPEPEGGFQVGDYVALAYSDHENHVFDNPVGFVVDAYDLDPGDPDLGQHVTVRVDGTISADRVSLLARPKGRVA